VALHSGTTSILCASETFAGQFKAALPNADEWKVEPVEEIGLDAGPFSKVGVPAVGFTTRTGVVGVSHTQLDNMTAIDLGLTEFTVKCWQRAPFTAKPSTGLKYSARHRQFSVFCFRFFF